MSSLLPLPIGPLTPRVEVVPAGDQRSVFLNGHLVARYPCHDRGTERIFVTQLAEVLPLPDRQLAGALLAGYRRAPVAPRPNYLPRPRGGPVPRPADPAPPTGPRTMVALVEIDRPGSQANMVRVIARLRPSSSLSAVSHDRGFTL